MSEPIAAIATPPVPSAIGIVRVSGEGAIEAASAVFRAASGRPLAACESRRLVYGTLLGPDGAPIDQVLAALPCPHSYTGEDTAELQCHALPQCWRWRWRPCLPGRPAGRAGEFTKRAFLNPDPDHRPFRHHPASPMPPAYDRGGCVLIQRGSLLNDGAWTSGVVTQPGRLRPGTDPGALRSAGTAPGLPASPRG